jgi:CheY-like chemotaxis protein
MIVPDPTCEAAKAAQNQLYGLQKSACEASKADEQAQCQSRKQECLSVAKACIATRDDARAAKIDRALLLWVDDNPENNIYERQALIEMGTQIILANNTQAALEQLKTHSIDVIISDFKRSDDPVGGYTLLEEVRKYPTPPPYIIFSGSSSAALAAEARRKGAYGETNQPAELFRLVIEAVKRSRIRR